MVDTISINKNLKSILLFFLATFLSLETDILIPSCSISSSFLVREWKGGLIYISNL